MFTSIWYHEPAVRIFFSTTITMTLKSKYSEAQYDDLECRHNEGT